MQFTTETMHKAHQQLNAIKHLLSQLNDAYKTNGSVPTQQEFKQLCDLLGGHNYSNELFDLNYGVVCLTILFKDNKYYELSPNVKIWEKDNFIEWDFQKMEN